MNEYAEFEGKNVEKALEKACEALNQAPDQLNYDVVSYGSSGIFGLVGVKKAKIRVKTGQAVASQIEDDAKVEARSLVEDAFEDEEGDSTDDGLLDKAIVDGRQALQRLVSFISEDFKIESERRNGRILFKVEGGDSALLIGKRGQTLEAIQYLIEKMINKQTDARIRVLVDVEGYLGARKSDLQRLASKMAEKAQKLSKPVTIGQMNAYDRRIVHLHLKDNPSVRTQSVGEGYYRKLIIFPKKRRRSKS
ncbi:MAG: KH domain-containing protein [Desulfobacteraceae bacterium]|nr:MAG: KH domain-containing protein [Desulfobacteraceae bacterium]